MPWSEREEDRSLAAASDAGAAPGAAGASASIVTRTQPLYTVRS